MTEVLLVLQVGDGRRQAGSKGARGFQPDWQLALLGLSTVRTTHAVLARFNHHRFALGQCGQLPTADALGGDA